MKKLTMKDSMKNTIHIYLYEAKGTPKGIVHIIHGASEHFARYGVFAEFLNEHGYHVIGADLLGHGLSTETLDYVHYADKGGDKLAFEGVTLVRDYIRSEFPKLPAFVLGHSMGSFLTRKLILEDPNTYQKAVISGTAMTPNALTSVAIALTGIIGFFRGKKHVSNLIQNMAIDANPARMKKDGIIGDFKEAWLTKDEEVQQYYHHSPMCGQPFTVQANQDMFRWIKFVNDVKNIRKGNKEMPLYFMSGEKDPLGDYGKGIQALVALFQQEGYLHVSMKLYENDRHEVLNELDKATAFADILAFLEA